MLARKGNHQLNLAVHRIALAQGRVHPGAKEYLARKQTEGRSRKAALRRLKRQLVRSVLRAFSAPSPNEEDLPRSKKTTSIETPQALVRLT
ncbi:hypothetical protein LCGC14_2147030 [marine sediment metagenome]|uniref:Transposase IS116/IS110/IS902 family protein n=1 Tax=marine sediment metagenome TaxID=412755 RepID=A0A0F9DWV2_9ZZZZ